MPKCYSDAERSTIRSRLMQEALCSLRSRGVRGTTVDHLVSRAGIPKGTFYLFFPSKEMLLYEAIEAQQLLCEERLCAAVSRALPSSCPVEALTEALAVFFEEEVRCTPIAHLDGHEMELLAQKLPACVLDAHIARRRSMFARVFGSLLSDDSADLLPLCSAFHAVYLCALHNQHTRLLSSQDQSVSLRLLLRGLVLQLLPSQTTPQGGTHANRP